MWALPGRCSVVPIIAGSARRARLCADSARAGACAVYGAGIESRVIPATAPYASLPDMLKASARKARRAGSDLWDDWDRKHGPEPAR